MSGRLLLLLTSYCTELFSGGGGKQSLIESDVADLKIENMSMNVCVIS